MWTDTLCACHTGLFVRTCLFIDHHIVFLPYTLSRQSLLVRSSLAVRRALGGRRGRGTRARRGGARAGRRPPAALCATAAWASIAAHGETCHLFDPYGYTCPDPYGYTCRVPLSGATGSTAAAGLAATTSCRDWRDERQEPLLRVARATSMAATYGSKRGSGSKQLVQRGLVVVIDCQV